MKNPKIEFEESKCFYGQPEHLATEVAYIVYEKNRGNAESYIADLKAVADILLRLADQNASYPSNDDDFPF